MTDDPTHDDDASTPSKEPDSSTLSPYDAKSLPAHHGDDSIDGTSDAALAALPRARWIGPLVAIGCLGLAAVSQYVADRLDHQLANIFSFAMVVTATITLLIWWALRPQASLASRLIPPISLVLAIALFFALFQYQGVSGELEPSFAWRFGQTKRPLPGVQKTTDSLDSSGPLESLPTSDAETTFAGFLGNHRNGTVAQRQFDTHWDRSPPEVLFHQSIGEGWSGPAVCLPLVFTMEQRDAEEWVTCYHVPTGKMIWQHSESARHEHPLGGVGPRSTPQWVDGKLYTQGATGIVLCLDAANGDVLWRVDLLELAGINQEQSEQIAPWGRAASPLIVDQMVILPLGGIEPNTSALVALDAITGQVVWKTNRSGAAADEQQMAMLGRSQISYASPIVATIDGLRQLVSINEADVCGYDMASGDTLWTHPWPGATNGGASCTQPMPVGNNQVLVSKGYGGGGMLIQVTQSDGKWDTQEVWHISGVLKTKFSNMAIKAGFAYAISDGILECVEIQSGQRRWRQPRRGRYMHGQLLLVDDVLLVLAEDGRVTLVQAQPDAFEEIASLQVIEGKTWSNPALVGNLLFVRNSQEFAALKLPSRQSP